METFKIKLILAIVLVSTHSYSQKVVHELKGDDPQSILAWQKQFQDPWFNKVCDSAVWIGEEFPDISLSPITNNTTGAKSLKDLRGKLVILDFWSTLCGPCMEKFPKMEKLQKEFGDKIQIFIVDLVESQEMIDKFLAKKKADGHEIRMPDLPSLVGPRPDIFKMVPLRSVPHHVWIDQNGIIRVRGFDPNTTEDNIRTFLETGTIDPMNDDKSTPGYYAKNIPYYQFLGKSIDNKKYSSNFYPYNKYVAAIHPQAATDQKDSINGGVRNTFINTDVFHLLFDAFHDKIHSIAVQFIASPSSLGIMGFQYGGSYIDVLKFNVSDPLRYSEAVKVADKTYQRFLKGKFSYEQITPGNSTKSDRDKNILKDLSEHFSKLYNVHVSMAWESRKIPCFLLVRTSKNDKVSSREKRAGAPVKVIVKDGKRMNDFKSSLSGVITSYINSETPLINTGYSGYIIDETGMMNKNIHMVLPEHVNCLDDLRAALREYDLDIIKSEKTIEFLTINED